MVPSHETRLARFGPAVCLGILLFFVFSLYRGAYFWVDDFNNLHAVRQSSLGESVFDVVSPVTTHFRPVGMLAYEVAFDLFGTNARFYHWLMWVIHSVNVGLVYAVLKRITQSRAGAVVGALCFACPPVFSETFWSFGTIFELAGVSLFLTGLLLWQRQRRSVAVVLGASAVFILAIKAKETAIVLPAIFMVQDLLLRRPLRWKEVALVIVPAAIGVWIGMQKVAEMGSANPADPYYLDLRGVVMGRGFGYYFNLLFQTNLRWQVWSIGFVALLLASFVMRWRPVAFFQIYIFIAFLPVIFLNNHRFAFYWYFPLLGVCGLVALIAKAIAGKFLEYVPSERAAVYGLIAFALLSFGNYVYFKRTTGDGRAWQHGVSSKFRAMIESLQVLPAPNKGETLYFKALPEYFDEERLLERAVEFALQRDDIAVRLVTDFPPDARYRLDLIDSRVVMQR